MTEEDEEFNRIERESRTKQDYVRDIKRPSREALIAEVAVLTELVRVLSSKVDELEAVAWGVDWGRDGQQSCVSIVKRLPNGGINVVAVEYNPTPASPQRSTVLEEVAQHFDKMTALGDTAASFAAYVRGMKS